VITGGGVIESKGWSLNAEIFVGIDRLASLLRLNFEFFLVAFFGIGDRTNGTTLGSCIIVVLFIEF